MRQALLPLLVLGLVGCSTTQGGPVVPSANVTGQATGHWDGTGAFAFQMPDGKKCTGTFSHQLNLLGGSEVTTPVACDGGLTGEAVIGRLPMGPPTSALVTWTDKTTAHVTFDKPLPPAAKAALPMPAPPAAAAAPPLPAPPPTDIPTR